MEKAAFVAVYLCTGILLFDFITLHGIFVYKKTDCILAVHANYGNCDNQLSLAYKWIYALFFACCTIFAIDDRVVFHRKRKYSSLTSERGTKDYHSIIQGVDILWRKKFYPL